MSPEKSTTMTKSAPTNPTVINHLWGVDPRKLRQTRAFGESASVLGLSARPMVNRLSSYIHTA